MNEFQDQLIYDPMTWIRDGIFRTEVSSVELEWLEMITDMLQYRIEDAKNLIPD